MVIGSLEVDIHLFSCSSLKDKRRVIKSLISRLRNRFNISIAEVGDYSLWQRAKLGIAFLSTDTGYSNRVLDKIIEFLNKEKDFCVIDFRKEII
ncbi:DUF503 domain-containing protein [Candidatus Aerophobetes bacterium]|nr:DUF503 domain-containing protein [Candidatus Aerophobetes bacterium]